MIKKEWHWLPDYKQQKQITMNRYSINEPTIISITHFGVEYTIKVKDSEVTAPGMLHHVCNLVQTLGYQIDKYVSLDELMSKEFDCEEKISGIKNKKINIKNK